MRTVFLCAAALAFCGCGGDKPMPMAATPESSRETLLLALDAWKAGKSFQELRDGNPPVQFLDEDFQRGSKLLDYQVQGEGQVYGTGYSHVVVIKVQDKDGGKTRDKKVAYTATTDPRRAVTRDDRKP